MTTQADIPQHQGVPRHRNLFGIPLDQFGWFATLLMSFSAGFLAFFLTCFIAIFTILIYNSATGHAIDYADSYKYCGLPAGLIVLTLSLCYMGFLWVRRITSGK